MFPMSIDPRLSPRQVALLVGFGIAAWAILIVPLRALMAAGWLDSGMMHAAIYAAMPPVGAALVWGARRLAGLSPAQLVPGVAVASASAMLPDGFVLAFVPAVYGMHPDLPRMVALLHWAVGSTLVVACVMAARGARHARG
jgi:hypothetical protein